MALEHVWELAPGPVYRSLTQGKVTEGYDNSEISSNYYCLNWEVVCKWA